MSSNYFLKNDCVALETSWNKMYIILNIFILSNTFFFLLFFYCIVLKTSWNKPYNLYN